MLTGAPDQKFKYPRTIVVIIRVQCRAPRPSPIQRRAIETTRRRKSEALIVLSARQDPVRHFQSICRRQ